MKKQTADDAHSAESGEETFSGIVFFQRLSRSPVDMEKKTVVNIIHEKESQKKKRGL